MPELRQIWTTMLQDTLETIVGAAPRVVGAIGLIILALVVARLIEKILRAILVRVHFDALLARVGIEQGLQRLGVRESINQIVPRVIYYLLLILFARTAADALGLVAISSAIATFMAFVPNIIAALLILVLGGAAAQWAGGAVTQAADNSGIEFAGSLGRLVTAILFFVLGVMAVSQLRIDTEMVRLVSTALLGGLALAFGLSLGLGSRDITRNMLAGFYVRQSFRVGEDIELGGQRGILHSITPTQTLIEHEGRLIGISNSRYFDDVVRQ